MKTVTFLAAVVCSICVIGVSSSALAVDLSGPIELESTQVLPAGVRNPRFKNLFMSVSDKFNGIGQDEPLGNKLNKMVSWGDIKDAQTYPEDKTMIDGVLKDNGIPANGSPGQTTGNVTIFADVKVPVLAIGVTERWTSAIAVPIMSIQVNADTGFVKSADGQAFVDAVCKTSSVDKCNDAKNKLNDAVNQKLTRLGYQPIPASQTFSGIGDIKWVNKYLVFQNGDDSFALKGELTLPTGRAADPDKALDVPLGDGQWDLGAVAIWDRRLDRDLTLNVFGGYTAQLPDTVVRRLPASVTDSLSADKELLHRDLGDIISAGTSLNYEIPRIGVLLGAGYSFQYLTPTSFENGNNPDKNRYRLLEAETPCQALHSFTMIAGFSTVAWYQQKKFVYPLQANLAYSRPLQGRNTTDNGVVTAELVLFF